MPRKSDSQRVTKYKLYYPNIVVAFNKKAQANTSNLLN